MANSKMLYMKQATNYWRIPAETEAVPTPKLCDSWPQAPSLFPSSGDEARKKHLRARRNAQASKANYL